MAFANFFDKAALAATQVLHGFDRTSLETILCARRVGIAFDSAACAAEGKTSLDLAVNLLARLYPSLAIVPLDPAAKRTRARLVTMAREINPALEVTEDLGRIDVCLVVGRTSVRSAGVAIYMGSDGWLALVSTASPVGSGVSHNPFGAGAAACLGVANVFRAVFHDQLAHPGLDDNLTLSLFDYGRNALSPANPPWRTVDIGECCLVGVGAIGGATVWTLAHARNTRGTLHLIDGEATDLSNLQRYVLTGQQHVGNIKVETATAVLMPSKLGVRPHPQRWGDYLRERGDWILPLVAVAVDSAEDRCAIQAALPRRILNAWTQANDLGVSRHMFLGDQACLACLYLPEGPGLNEDERVAREIGLPKEVRAVRELLYSGSPVGKELTARMADALGIPHDAVAPFADRPLRAFYTEAVCGGMVMRLQATTGTSMYTEVPLAFQSAMAGVMLAAEILIDAGGLREEALPTITRLNLMQPVPECPTSPRAKDPLRRCICQDEDYIQVYEAKYLR